MQIRTRIKTARPENEFDKSLEQELLSAWRELSNAINNGLRLEDNLDGSIITISDTGAANSENTLAHNLKRVPIGFLMINTDRGTTVYDSGTAWTTTNIYIKFGTANCAVKIIVF